MRMRLAVLLLTAAVAGGLAGCTAIDEATEDHPVRAPGQSGYQVVPAPGETIESVADRFDVSRDALIQANHLKFPYILQPRQTLIVPPPANYRVHSGDTVAGIATILGVDETALARANGLQKPYHMAVGQVLTVPGGIGGAIASAKKPAVEPGFTGVAPAPRSTISKEALAPPSGISSGMNTAPYAPPPPMQQPSIAPQQSLPSLPAAPQTPQPQSLRAPSPQSAQTALAPQAPAQLPTQTPTQNSALASAAPTAIIPPAPAAPSVPATPPPESLAPPAAASVAGGAPHFIKPVGGQIIEGFGADGAGQTNDGVNIGAAAGTPVKAADAGTVIYTGNELAAFGNLILVRHAGGWVTAYGHLATIGVQRGQTVTQGQALGAVGQTGSASTPQLHFEIRQGSKPVDPAPYLNGAKG